MTSKKIYAIILLIFVASFISSSILSFAPIDEGSKFCNTNGACGSIQNSKYGYTFNIKNSHYGVGIFALLSLITILQIRHPTKQKKKIINTSIIAGSAIALYFLYLQFFVIHEFCRYCLIIDIGLLISLILIIPRKWFKNKK